MSRRTLVSAFILLLFVISPLCCANNSTAATPDIPFFDVKVVDNEGNETDDYLAHRYTVDTFTDQTGTTFFLKAHLSLQAIPANILIVSDEGEFNLCASITGLSSYLKDSGVRIELRDSDKTYTSDLTESNNFDGVYFRDENGLRAVLQPNTIYPFSIKTLDDVEHQVAPEKVKDVVVTFSAHLTDGFHQVAFYSEGQLIDTYKLTDGQTIRPTPIVERDGYEFNGWFTKNGEQIQEGRVVTENDGDIIAYANWTELSPSSSGTNFNWIIPIIITAVILGLLIIFLVYRRRRSASA